MVHRFAEDYESTDQSGPEGVRASKQPNGVVDRLINYARANPTEAIVVATGAALALGLIVGYPRLQTKQERMAREFERRVRQAYADVHSAPDSHTWDRLSEWAKANLPTALR